MTCKECCYYWKDENDDWAYCHFVDRCPGDKAPCEYDEEDYTDD